MCSHTATWGRCGSQASHEDVVANLPQLQAVHWATHTREVPVPSEFFQIPFEQATQLVRCGRPRPRPAGT